MTKKYIPTEKEKYMCAKHKAYFKKRLIDWKKEIVEINSKNLYLKEVDNEISSPDIVDQASSQTDKNVEMNAMIFEWVAVGPVSTVIYQPLLERFQQCR